MNQRCWPVVKVLLIAFCAVVRVEAADAPVPNSVTLPHEYEGVPWGSSEYAVRWEAAGTIFTEIQPVIDLLMRHLPQGAEAGTAEFYRVGYWIWKDENENAILRSRNKIESDGIKPKLTYKVRSDEYFTPAKDQCRLNDVKGNDKKSEVDASVLPTGGFRQAFSYSCDRKGSNPPSDWSVTEPLCYSDMTRRSIAYGQGSARREVKIERWVLPDKSVMLEVSRGDATTNAAANDFYNTIANPLIAAGIKPVGEGKTQAASDCATKTPSPRAERSPSFDQEFLCL